MVGSGGSRLAMAWRAARRLEGSARCTAACRRSGRARCSTVEEAGLGTTVETELDATATVAVAVAVVVDVAVAVDAAGTAVVAAVVFVSVVEIARVASACSACGASAVARWVDRASMTGSSRLTRSPSPSPAPSPFTPPVVASRTERRDRDAARTASFTETVPATAGVSV